MALREAVLPGVLLVMAYDPLFIVLLVLFLILVLLVAFTFLTYLYLKMAVRVQLMRRGKK